MLVTDWGINTSRNAVLLNELVFMVNNVFPNVTLVNALQEANDSTSINVNEFGNVTAVKDVQLANALFAFILFRVSGNVTLVNDAHSQKAVESIDVTPFGIVILVIPEDLKRFAPTFFMVVGRTMLFNEVQL